MTDLTPHIIQDWTYSEYTPDQSDLDWLWDSDKSVHTHGWHRVTRYWFDDGEWIEGDSWFFGDTPPSDHDQTIEPLGGERP